MYTLIFIFVASKVKMSKGSVMSGVSLETCYAFLFLFLFFLGREKSKAGRGSRKKTERGESRVVRLFDK